MGRSIHSLHYILLVRPTMISAPVPNWSHLDFSGGSSLLSGWWRIHSRASAMVLGLIGGQRGASGPRRFCRSTALPARFCPEGSLIESLTRCMALPKHFRYFFLFFFSIFNCFFFYGLMNGPSHLLTKVHWSFPAPSMDTKKSSANVGCRTLLVPLVMGGQVSLHQRVLVLLQVMVAAM